MIAIPRLGREGATAISQMRGDEVYSPLDLLNLQSTVDHLREIHRLREDYERLLEKT
jgi:hypothetical protein